MIKLIIIGIVYTCSFNEQVYPIYSDFQETYSLGKAVIVLHYKPMKSNRVDMIHTFETLSILDLESRKSLGLYGKVSPGRGALFRYDSPNLIQPKH